MQTAGFPRLHAWFIRRRTEILARLAQEMAAHSPLLPPRARPGELWQAPEQLLGGFLLALAEARGEALADPVGEVLLARVRADLPLVEALAVVGVVRRIFLRLVVAAVAEGVEDAAAAVTFLDEAFDRAATHVAALHGDALARARTALEQSEEQHRWLWQSLPAMMHSIDAEGRLCMVNDRWLATLGYAPEEALGRRSSEFLTPESARYAREEVLPAFYRTGRCDNVLYQMVCKDGRVIDVMLSAIAERDATDKVVRSQAVLIDVTERRHAEETTRRGAMQEELIRAQQSMLRALSTPLVPLGEGMLLMPLVGAVDRARATQIQVALLEGVQAHAAAVAILDVTGVPAMDEAVSESLATAAKAVRLLGAHVFVTGLSAAAARTLAMRGVELGGVSTHATVRDGIAAARRRIEQAAPRRPLQPA
jgi:PAS domain S-box-containing protein